MALAFNSLEQEILALNLSRVMIDDMANYSIFVKPNGIKDVTFLPQTAAHQKLFNILLVDFLSLPKLEFGLPRVPRDVSQSQRSYLNYLTTICEGPEINPTATKAIQEPTSSFIEWLEETCLARKVWLPSIDTELDVKIKRVSLITICGNISKHSPARLHVDVNEIRKILRENGCEVGEEKGYLVISDFYTWFRAGVPPLGCLFFVAASASPIRGHLTLGCTFLK